MSDHAPVHLPTPIPPTSPHSTLPTVVQHPGQAPYYAAPPQFVVVPQQPAASTPLSPVTTRLLLGGGIGAGAVVGFAIVGPTLIVTLQSLAITALAIGGSALGIAVAAHLILRTFTGTKQPTKKER